MSTYTPLFFPLIIKIIFNDMISDYFLTVELKVVQYFTLDFGLGYMIYKNFFGGVPVR